MNNRISAIKNDIQDKSSLTWKKLSAVKPGIPKMQKPANLTVPYHHTW